MEEDEKFEEDLNDPLLQAELQEIYEEEMSRSMEWAYQAIHEMSFDRWTSVVPLERERKRRIIENMIHWFEEREEYERCAFLHRGLRETEINESE